ncbi:MAG: hypothetical protein GF331_12680 [Chitinivibrionales bacterium]|nr:hypothetical protein [Chitinivibrionales bacterium]
MDDRAKRELLKAYESYVPSGTPLVERTFKAVFALTLLAFIGLGLYFRTVKPVQQEFYERVRRLRTEFLVREPEKKPPPPKKVEKKPQPDKPAEKPIDLSDKPKLAQKDDDIQEPKPKKTKKVRRVYGLKKVYSRGLGSGGSLSDAVIGKLGNTLNKDVDTITATEEDIKGEVVSVTTVTEPPRPLRKGKVEYSEEMLEAGFEGKVKVKCLIDVDGRVKKALPLSDPGYGAATMAAKFCFDTVFEPAKRLGEPVAVWLTITVSFRMLG